MTGTAGGFELATMGEVSALISLRDELARWLLGRGIEHWLPAEFPTARMRSWVERGDVFVRRSSKDIIAAVAVLDEDSAVWTESDARAGYIHLLMVDRAHAGMGLGDAALVHAEQQIRARGRDVARLDAVASNSTLLAWYAERGYCHVGTKSFDAPEVFDCELLEKALD